MSRKYVIFIVILCAMLFGCPNPNNSDDEEDVDISTLPASNATAPSSADEARTIYNDASTVLYDAMDSESRQVSRTSGSRAAQTTTLNQTIAWSNAHVTMTGTITGSTISNPPSSMTQGTYDNVMKALIEFNLHGTMTELEVTDPEDATKSFIISGTIEHSMSTDMEMDLVIGSDNSITPSGHFESEIEMRTAYTIKRVSDGVGAKFVLTFTDTKNQTITPTAAGSGVGEMGDPTCGYFEKTATLKAYDDSDNLIYEAEVPLQDIPWTMAQSCGAGGGGSGPGPGPGTDEPITLPDTVNDDPAFDAMEEDFFDAINTDRTGHSAAAFASRDTDLDALARRYASTGQCDTPGTNLEGRVADALGTCSDAAYFLFSASSLNVNTAMTQWLSQTGGTASMRNTGFTGIGIGIITIEAAGGVPDDTWDCVVVLLATP